MGVGRERSQIKRLRRFVDGCNNEYSRHLLVAEDAED